MPASSSSPSRGRRPPLPGKIASLPCFLPACAMCVRSTTVARSTAECRRRAMTGLGTRTADGLACGAEGGEEDCGPDSGDIGRTARQRPGRWRPRALSSTAARTAGDLRGQRGSLEEGPTTWRRSSGVGGVERPRWGREEALQERVGCEPSSTLPAVKHMLQVPTSDQSKGALVQRYCCVLLGAYMGNDCAARELTRRFRN